MNFLRFKKFKEGRFSFPSYVVEEYQYSPKGLSFETTEQFTMGKKQVYKATKDRMWWRLDIRMMLMVS